MLDLLREATDRTASVVAAVPERSLGAATPCPDWDVRELVNHAAAGNLMFAEIARGGSFDPALFARDHVGDDPAGAYRRTADETLEAWDRPGVLDETLAFAGLPGRSVLGLHIGEALVHGWDVAQATGQSAGLPAAACEAVLGVVRQLPPEMVRSPGAFGPEVEAPADASSQDRLVAFLGRTP